MSYQVIARKWRPQEFGTVVGQDAVVRSLTNALEQDRVAHAFLFSGVRGVGKTTTARILAKALNCEQGPTTEPCGRCASCGEIAGGTSIDVLEIDAASNTGVDNIRDLRESSRYGTARDRFKIFIIDEVHMLSKGAFNALLKTLEEPPDHVKFILATTEDQKVPITIRSRCQHYEFKPIPFPLILERLRLIAESDGITVSDEALRTIAARAEGSLRDAQSALDQVVAFSGREIADGDVRQVLGVVDRRRVAEILEAVLDRDREALLRSLATLGDDAITPSELCHGLVEYLRVLMLCRAVGWDPQLLEIGESDRAVVEAHAARVSEIDLIRFYDLASATEAELKWHRHPQAHLEISLLKLIELAHLPSLEKVLSGLGPDGEVPRPGRPRTERRDSTDPGAASSAAAEVEQPPAATPSGQDTSPGVAADPVAQLLALLQTESMGLYQHLYRADEIELSADLLRIVFSASEKIHAEFLQDEQRSRQLLSACEKIVGSRPAIDIGVGAEPQPATHDPTDDPGVQELLKRYPGKVIVNRDP